MPYDLTDVMQRLSKIEANQDNHGEKLDAIDHALNGNGQPGLKADVIELKGWAGLTKWVAAAIILAVIGLAVNDFYKLFVSTAVAQTTQKTQP